MAKKTHIEWIKITPEFLPKLSGTEKLLIKDNFDNIGTGYYDKENQMFVGNLALNDIYTHYAIINYPKE